MTIKQQIKAAKTAIKLADKNPMLYSDEEIRYMKMKLRSARESLEKHRQNMSKGFKNDISKTSNSDTRRREDDGVCSEGEQSIEPGKS